MTAPTAPYCGTDDVALLVQNLIQGASDFSASTNPKKTYVEKMITWKSSEVDRAFSAVGYYVPFQDISSGDAWPDSQTTVLEFMVAVAVAGLIVGPVVKPAPSMGRPTTSANEFTASFNAFLADIKESGAGFRAKYRVGSKAEQWCKAPVGPTTDYLSGYLDYTLFQTVEEYTGVIESLRSDYNIPASVLWDHLKVKRDALLS